MDVFGGIPTIFQAAHDDSNLQIIITKNLPYSVRTWTYGVVTYTKTTSDGGESYTSYLVPNTIIKPAGTSNGYLTDLKFAADSIYINGSPTRSAVLKQAICALLL